MYIYIVHKCHLDKVSNLVKVVLNEEYKKSHLFGWLNSFK